MSFFNRASRDLTCSYTVSVLPAESARLLSEDGEREMNRRKAKVTADMLKRISKNITDSAKKGDTSTFYKSRLGTDIPIDFNWNQANEVNERIVYALTELGYKASFRKSNDLGVYEGTFLILWEDKNQ